MQSFTIGEVAESVGVGASTLRYYEQIGLLPEPKRVSGQRRYGSDVLQQLAIIQVAKAAGFTLREIQTLLHGFSDDEPPSMCWKALAVQKIPELEALIERTKRMKFLLEEGLNCDCLSLDECMLIFNYEPDAQS